MEHVTEKTLQILDEEIMKLIEMGDMTKESLTCLDKLVDMKKETLETAEMEAQREMGQGNSYYGGERAYTGYRMPNMYAMPQNYGGSYAQRRDSMGRYSRNSEREQIRANIERQLDAAQSDAEREMIHRILATI